MASTSEPVDVGLLREHGDTQVPAGLLDLAVNVHPEPPPGLGEVLASVDVRAYPDPTGARAVLAARHEVDADHVLLVNGAAEAFWALAHAAGPGSTAPCVHPSFTAPEAAFRSAGVPVRRVLRRPEEGFALDPDQVDPDSDVVVLGRPDNPTGRSEDVEVVHRLVRPDRLLVVDEAFAEHTGDGLGLTARRRDLPGLVQVRSLTKIWGVAGLRVGYVVAEPGVVDRLAAVLQPWPVNAVALALVERLFTAEHRDAAEVERRRRAVVTATDRDRLVPRLAGLGLAVWAGEGPYLLLRGPVPDLRGALLPLGVAARRCDTFPGLDDTFVRIAVPTTAADADLLVAALRRVLAGVTDPTAEYG